MLWSWESVSKDKDCYFFQSLQSDSRPILLRLARLDSELPFSIKSSGVRAQNWITTYTNRPFLVFIQHKAIFYFEEEVQKHASSRKSAENSIVAYGENITFLYQVLRILFAHLLYTLPTTLFSAYIIFYLQTQKLVDFPSYMRHKLS